MATGIKSFIVVMITAAILVSFYKPSIVLAESCQIHLGNLAVCVSSDKPPDVFACVTDDKKEPHCISLDDLKKATNPIPPGIRKALINVESHSTSAGANIGSNTTSIFSGSNKTTSGDNTGSIMKLRPPILKHELSKDNNTQGYNLLSPP